MAHMGVTDKDDAMNTSALLNINVRDQNIFNYTPQGVKQ